MSTSVGSVLTSAALGLLSRSSANQFGVHKCWLLPHKCRARPPLLLIPCRNEVTYLGVKFLAPSRIGAPWSLKLHLEDLGNQIRQKSHILRHLRCPRLKIPAGILRSLFQGWIGGLIRFSLPIFSDNADAFLEASFSLALRALAGLPPKCPNSALYVAANVHRSSICALPLDTGESADSSLYLAPIPSYNTSGAGSSQIQRIPSTKQPRPPLLWSVMRSVTSTQKLLKTLTSDSTMR